MYILNVVSLRSGKGRKFQTTQSFYREYESYKMSSLEIIEQNLSQRVTDLVDKMIVYGEDTTDNKVVKKILRAVRGGCRL